jgi:hypothetical protein
MKELTYNSNLDRYSVQLDNHAKTGDPIFLIVEGSEMAESISDGGDLDELCQDVTMWENLADDRSNQNVYFANTPNEFPWL